MLDLCIEDCSTDPDKDCSWEEEKVESLRQRILGEKSLVSRTDDVFLRSFLRARKFSEDDAIKWIKRYYEGRKKFPAVFNNLRPSALQKFLDGNITGYLKNTDSIGRVILIGISRNWNPSQMTVWEAFQGFTLMLELLLTNDLVQRNGIVVVIDFGHLSWGQIIQFTPNFIYTANSCMLGGFPIRYKQIHLVSSKKFVYWITSSLLIFTSRKIQERVFVHSDWKSLHKMIEPKYLPSDFGGELPPFNSSHCNEKIRENEEYFKDCESYWNPNEAE